MIPFAIREYRSVCYDAENSGTILVSVKPAQPSVFHLQQVLSWKKNEKIYKDWIPLFTQAKKSVFTREEKLEAIWKVTPC